MQAFSTPKSREWSGVTAQQAVVNGNCPSIKCNYCDKVFAGNASRIRAHYLKCLACPSPLSPKGAHFLGADDMANVNKDCEAMAGYMVESMKATKHEKSFFLAVLDGALRAAFPHLEKAMPWLTAIWCACHILSLFFKDC